MRENIVVVGVDNSDTAFRAAEAAAEIAVAFGARLHVVSAFEDDRTEVYGVGSDQWIESGATFAERVAKKVASDLTWPEGREEISYIAARGKPADAILEEAERLQARLVVVGNRRMQGIGRILGSIANSVAHGADCDVYIVNTTGEGA
ncbi:universal stress protein [Sinomonas sp. ASV322]|uniref:universal stress protein n=1 Tax=Sinomonas sp. ASV322 TaxID=3041920 RepID=UPI0027DADC72|nr:universal stress protein [Sinomonas sp. ASV322]MDQ4501557.1 universal stress protein [Sinomonas sp. ASV322]